MDAYVARQPIFNKSKKIFAYELLFRNGTANYVPEIDGDTATTTLLSNSFFSIGLDAISGGKKSFINFTENLLINKIPQLLPRENIVVEILEDVKPEKQLVEACRELSEDGYIMALDDFEYHPSLDPLISLANIIKFDFLLTPVEEIRAYIKKLPDRKIVLLAEKVETNEEFQVAMEMGFALFQGYFFRKPDIVHDKEIPGNQLTLMQIMAEVNRATLSIDKMEKLVSQDMGMSYKLLRYINSAFFARATKISSIRQALVYMGDKEIKRFVSLVSMSRLTQGKPTELLRTSCIRGKFCELLGSMAKSQMDLSELFTTGMFSLIDAVIDQPMSLVMAKLPLSKDIVNAILNDTGPISPYLTLSACYENGDWEGVSRIVEILDIDEGILPQLYLEACQWSDRVSRI